nr:hypothetical protein RKHAN_02390 [Rhizobium sp. Khangiran2]
MARPKLSHDAVISDVIPTLMSPVEYVRAVFHNVHEFRKQHGSGFVRIGITGRGKAPHYRIEPDFELGGFLDDIIEGGEAVAKHYSAFDGRSHTRLEWGMDELRNEHWSQGKMSYEEIRDLLGYLRGI